ncbi:MAG TPA: hypothetical protein ENG33_00935, partial [Chloroflexi bacterium]|nr:hypothetical protein [Chloroflexota bacterium]
MEEATLFERTAIYSVVVVAVAALIYAYLLARQVLKEDTGTPKMRAVSDGIREGALAYLNKQ